MSSQLSRWFYKYKGLHVLMWTFTMGFSFVTYFNPARSVMAQVANVICSTGLNAVPFYLCGYVLVPQLLYKRRFAAFILIFIFMVLFWGLTVLFITRVVDRAFDHAKNIIPTWAILGPSINLFMWNTALAAFGSSGFKILFDRFRIEKKLHEVEKEKITTELSFLRSQINPHFLFNIMNTIYFQIDKSNTEARLSVEKFSEMLRYQLYECTTDMIHVDKELNYIKNYMAIQTLRMEKESDVQLMIGDKTADFCIAPFLILPIVENAFKHVSNFKNSYRNKIYVGLTVLDNNIFMVEATNTYEQHYQEKHLMQSGGLGIQNLKRRLELLYPDRHELNVNYTENTYQTILKLKYDDIQFSAS
jgi:two-component system LytT family sensor kinase